MLEFLLNVHMKVALYYDQMYIESGSTLDPLPFPVACTALLPLASPISANMQNFSDCYLLVLRKAVEYRNATLAYAGEQGADDEIEDLISANMANWTALYNYVNTKTFVSTVTGLTVTVKARLFGDNATAVLAAWQAFLTKLSDEILLPDILSGQISHDIQIPLSDVSAGDEFASALASIGQRLADTESAVTLHHSLIETISTTVSGISSQISNLTILINDLAPSTSVWKYIMLMLGLGISAHYVIHNASVGVIAGFLVARLI